MSEEQKIKTDLSPESQAREKVEGVELLSNNDEILRLGIGGRVDTNNASEVEKDIDKILTDNEFNTLILDLNDLEYISSVGIRILMKLFKTYQGMKIENTSKDVYDVLNMTGITNVIPVTKKMREFSIEGLGKIGSGYNGAVYRLDDETIIKVINEMNSLEDIQKERDTAQKAFLLGLPTAISYDVVKVGNHYGIIYELLNSKSYTDKLRENQDRIEELGREFGKLIRLVNNTDVDDDSLNNVKQMKLAKIDAAKAIFDEEDYQMIRHLFEIIPESKTFVHGDFHPGNVLVQDDQPLLIDLATSGFGHPIFDLISFTQPVIGAVEDHPEEDYVSEFTGLTKKQNYELWDAYLREYFDTDDDEYIEKIKEEILLRARAMKAIDLKYYAIMLQNQEKAMLETDDQIEVIRDIGAQRLFNSVEDGLKRIRNTLENREDEFFF